MPAITAAFQKIRPGYRPKLTIIICVGFSSSDCLLALMLNDFKGKRHHTRFFPTEVQGADHKSNPLPGTVVDRGITSVYLFDFFLQGKIFLRNSLYSKLIRTSPAHGSIQGTAKPTHYHVIHDEMNFTADKVQTLTNNICHMFARATKAVSLASPAYYADLACERGRCYLRELLQGYWSDGGTATSGDEEQVRKNAFTSWMNGPTGNNIRNIMFYL